eukprot:CAMPEP_0179043990 /NCGR_PEP_ID=MMETSP0796-20121207/17444_1 /TAXON_ID=73915 /ORGANISM="Pyrodinium bahamense, Strain pbaha01" /LENGTH=224 /DNA_ID=CAMNT_0020740377 /DNA_START=125 /DNA_END=799 /DNA_ORIENTATION=+
MTLLSRVALCPKSCTTEECGIQNPADKAKPIVQVLTEQPDINGFCYFAQLGAPGFDYVPSLMKRGTWLTGLGSVEDATAVGNQPVKPSNVTLSYKDPAAPGGAVSLSTHLLPAYGGSAYDIPYCHALGWLQGMRLDGDLVRNFTAWQELGESECQRLKRLEDFEDGQFTMDYHIKDRTLTARDFRAHVYGKCLLGSVGSEMLWCYFGIGCLIGDNYVGHGRECH